MNNHAHVLDGIDEWHLQFMALFINAIDLRPYLTGTAQPKKWRRIEDERYCCAAAAPYRAAAHRGEGRRAHLDLCGDRLEASARTQREAHTAVAAMLGRAVAAS